MSKPPSQNYTIPPRYGRASQSSARNTKKHFRRHANTNRFAGLETDDDNATDDGGGVTPWTPTRTRTRACVARPTPSLPTPVPVPAPAPVPVAPEPETARTPATPTSCVKHYGGDRYADQTYHLMYGSQRIDSATAVVVSSCAIARNHDDDADATTGTTPLRFNAMAESCVNNTSAAVSFFGKCFVCHYLSHSQKNCPLRQCPRCKRYGHAESVCGFPLH